ncbi:MAG: pyridoxal 5'-phosphate synthase glutaminase subunit PdxT [Acidimicrobiia bacterium]
MKVGVLALQGAFREHRETFDALDVDTVEVRTPEALGGLDALVIPGGESTTMQRLLDTSGLREPLADALRDGLGVLGTCAGLIVLAREVLDGRPDQRPLGAIDVVARRNAYGRQRDSFEADLRIEGLPGGPFPGVFIRAPVIVDVGETVEVVAEHNGRPVMAREDRVWVTTFHPELSGDLRVHERFLQEVD